MQLVLKPSQQLFIVVGVQMSETSDLHSLYMGISLGISCIAGCFPAQHDHFRHVQGAPIPQNMTSTAPAISTTPATSTPTTRNQLATEAMGNYSHYLIYAASSLAEQSSPFALLIDDTDASVSGLRFEGQVRGDRGSGGRSGQNNSWRWTSYCTRNHHSNQSEETSQSL